jgi:hypothetical protein
VVGSPGGQPRWADWGLVDTAITVVLATTIKHAHLHLYNEDRDTDRRHQGEIGPVIKRRTRNYGCLREVTWDNAVCWRRRHTDGEDHAGRPRLPGHTMPAVTHRRSPGTGPGKI